MKPELMNDLQLATCVDEFVQRAIKHARDKGYDKAINVQIVASQYNTNDEYKIEHIAQVGEWNREIKSSTNNLVGSVDNVIARYIEDNLAAPTCVRPMVTYDPTNKPEDSYEVPAPAAEEAEFSEVQPEQGTWDSGDVPF